MPSPQTFVQPIGLYRSGMTTPEQLRHVTVGREDFLADIRGKLHGSLDRKSKQHSLFIGPRGSGKTHLLSLIVQEIRDDATLAENYVVARFPEESLRLLSYVDLLFGVCEILRDTLPPDQATLWDTHYNRLVEEQEDDLIRDTLEAEIKHSIRDAGKTLLIMLENFNEILTKQVKRKQDAAAMRKLFMGDNGCMLIATAPLYFAAVTDVRQPFYDFFDTQLLSNLTETETIEMIRLNLEWDDETHKELLESFDDLRPKISALHQITDGNPRLTMMLYELIAHESVLSARDQFMRLLDRITPFYQDRIKDIPPQERAILETMAKMRGVIKTPGAIAARMRLTQQQTSSLLQRLTKSNYVRSMPNPGDKRSRIYVIREGFFDLWLAMNVSRAEYVRLPFLVEFFEKWYRSLDEREQRRQSLYALLKRSETRDEAATALDYLSEVGTEEERAVAKATLASKLSEIGVAEQADRYVVELQRLRLDGLGGWIADHTPEWRSTSVDFYADLEHMIQCWRTQRAGDLEAFVSRLRTMGEALNLRGYSEAKVQFLEEALEHVSAPGERIPTRMHLAALFIDTADWQRAEAHVAAAVEEARQGDDKRVLATTISNLAYLQAKLGRYRQAEPLMQHALQSSEMSLGPNHPAVAISLNNLALLLKNTNRTAEAESLFRRALQIDERHFGPSHPTVARTLSNLAALLQTTNRLAEAEPLIRRALQIDRENSGPDHPHTVTCLSNLAQLLRATSRVAEAEALMRQTLELDERRSGPDHPAVAIRLNNLAMLLQDMNRLAEAEPLMRRALEIDEKVFGPHHPDVARDLNNLARLLHVTNRPEEAEPLVRRALGIDQRCFGPDHPAVARDLGGLGQLLKATNRLPEAEPVMRRALEINEEGLGPAHPDAAVALSNLAQLLGATERAEQAQPMMRRAVSALLQFQKTTGHAPPHMQSVIGNYAALLKQMGYSQTEIMQQLGELADPQLDCGQSNVENECPLGSTGHRAGDAVASGGRQARLQHEAMPPTPRG